MPSSSVTPSAAGLRALAHPTRLRLLGLLRLDGPATATSLARSLKLNSGATSYHLRQLAEHGFVVEEADRGAGRERWWMAAHQSTRTKIADRDETEREDVDAYLHTVALQYTELLMQSVTERPELSVEWQRACSLSDWKFRVTPQRAETLVNTLSELLDQWSDEGEDVGDSAEYFIVNLNAFPRPGTLVREDGADR